MLDFSHIPTSTKADVQVFAGSTGFTSNGWRVWTRPRGASMLHILCIGSGGDGGNGAVGAASTAAGGGGGGSGGQASLVVPAILLPDTLYVTVMATPTLTSYVSLHPSVVANNPVIGAAGGGTGGNASGATAGTAGAAAGALPMSVHPLAGLGF